MYASVPAITRGGSGRLCSRVRRDAIAKPVNHAPPPAKSTNIFAGLTSLWIRPRSCTRRSAAASGIAMRRNCTVSSGLPASLSSGSPPGSSSTNMARSPSRRSSRGRAAHALSSSSFNSYSWVSRSRCERDGRSAAGKTTRTDSPGAVIVQAPRSAQDALAVFGQGLIFIQIHAVLVNRRTPGPKSRRSYSDTAATDLG